MYIMYKRRCTMQNKISTAMARKNFADIVNRVAYGKESIILTRRGQGIAALVSIEELELLKKIEDHIDIEEARKSLEEPGENISATDFWESLC